MVGIGRGGVGLAGDWRECLAEAHASEAVAGEGDDTSGTSHASLAESQRNIATARAVGGQEPPCKEWRALTEMIPNLMEIVWNVS